MYAHGLRCLRPKNEAEGELYDKMKAAGWACTKRGWPDFFCINEQGDVCIVEVKPRASDRLKREQSIIMKALRQKGINVLRWSPDGGFSRDFE